MNTIRIEEEKAAVTVNELIRFIRNAYPEKEIISLHEPVFVGNERKYVLDAIDSTFVSSVGKYVTNFENLVKEYTGAKYAIATVNGTAALHMSLILAGVKATDLVITQSLSFIATCNAISYLQAKPVFVDIDKHTLGLSPSALRKYLSDNAFVKNAVCYEKTTGNRISACVPMHTFGHPCLIDEIAEICNQYNLALVEDAAESLGSFYKGQHTGNFGLLGAFSFNGNKTVTCGGGGAIITNDENLAKLGKHLTTQAKAPHRWDFVHDQIGYNYRMPNINAALACAQMEQIEIFIEEKRSFAKEYSKFFCGSSLQFVDEPVEARSNYWLNAVLASDRSQRDELLTALNDAGILARPCWRLMHKLDMFNECRHDNQENAEWIESRLVNIPSGVRLV